jgi:hypothetical protein
MLVNVRLGWLWQFFRLASRRRDRAGHGDAAVRRPDHDFHVVSNQIRIVFDVPLPSDGVDDVLRDLLLHHGLELIRERKASGQPLGGIETTVILTRQGDVEVEVGTLDLRQPGELVEIDAPRLIPIGASPADDPLRQLESDDIHKVLPLVEAAAGDELAPIGDDLQLTAGVSAGLRALGIDPDNMTASQLAVGLLEIAGYTLTARTETSFVATGGGQSTLVFLVDHVAGSYPELSEHAIAEFLVAFASAHSDRGLLVTDKYGPYEIYEKERANPKCHFITRERMQAFVDSIALGRSDDHGTQA